MRDMTEDELYKLWLKSGMADFEPFYDYKDGYIHAGGKLITKKQKKIVKEKHYGRDVWTNTFMDELRKKECLCLNCKLVEECKTAKELYKICIQNDIALAVTRCPNWVESEGE